VFSNLIRSSAGSSSTVSDRGGRGRGGGAGQVRVGGRAPSTRARDAGGRRWCPLPTGTAGHRASELTELSPAGCPGVGGGPGAVSGAGGRVRAGERSRGAGDPGAGGPRGHGHTAGGGAGGLVATRG